MSIHTRVEKLTAGGTNLGGTISVTPCRYAGMYYEFTPNRGTADITLRSLGRTLHSKTNANNNDGVQELLPDEEKLVNGDIVYDINQVQTLDQVKLTLFFER